MKPEAVAEKRKDKIPYDFHKKEFIQNLPDLLQKFSSIYDKSKNLISVKVLGDIYTVDCETGDVNGNDSSIKYPIKTLILRYLINYSDAQPGEKMLNYRDVPDGNLYYNNFYGRCIMRLCNTFKDKFDLLISAMDKLECEKLTMGDISYKIEFIKNFYVYIILYSQDEEFPPSAQILFSDNASLLFTAEDLAVVGDIINDKLAKLAFS